MGAPKKPVRIADLLSPGEQSKATRISGKIAQGTASKGEREWFASYKVRHAAAKAKVRASQIRNSSVEDVPRDGIPSDAESVDIPSAPTATPEAPSAPPLAADSPPPATWPQASEPARPATPPALDPEVLHTTRSPVSDAEWTGAFSGSEDSADATGHESYEPDPEAETGEPQPRRQRPTAQRKRAAMEAAMMFGSAMKFLGARARAAKAPLPPIPDELIDSILVPAAYNVVLESKIDFAALDSDKGRKVALVGTGLYQIGNAVYAEYVANQSPKRDAIPRDRAAAQPGTPPPTPGAAPEQAPAPDNGPSVVGSMVTEAMSLYTVRPFNG